MTLLRAHVSDFQSISNVEVEFGRFTVMVGPSNSGKSAFLRALRGLLRNTVVPANVRQGTDRAVLAATFDQGEVSAERGKSLSTYRLGEEVYTKSGRTVPPDVARFIALPEIAGIDATFAFQFDKPFLLSEPGATAAAVIGSLTNVSVLHAAVREANRRRSEVAATLKVRRTDVERYTDALDEFRDLPQRRATLEAAEQALEAVQSLQERRTRVAALLTQAVAAQERLKDLHAVEPPDVDPDLTEVDALLSRRADLLRASLQAASLKADLVRLVEQAKQHRAAAEQASQAHQQTLVEMGVCPTCGQEVTA